MDNQIASLEEGGRNIDRMLSNPKLDPRVRGSLLARKSEIAGELGDARRLREFCEKGAEEADILTGVWSGDDGALYYVRQVGAKLWWAGMSTSSFLGGNDFQPGIQLSNVYEGRIEGLAVHGRWADVPRGVYGQGSGVLDLTLGSPLGRVIVRGGASGNFGATRWTRVAGAPERADVAHRFDRVMRNDGGTMHDHLKLYRDNVVVRGTVAEDLTASAPTGSGIQHRNFTYANFMCNALGSFDEDDLDGDLNLRIRMTPDDRARLDRQPGFWTEGWMNDPEHIRRKLDDRSRDRDFGCDGGRPCNGVHPEVIMYGRPAGKDDCGGGASPLLPGWMERSANSVLWNGWPVEGNVSVATGGLYPVRIYNRSLPPGTRVRVTGTLTLDCHGVFGDCEEGDAAKHNVELHPVYSIDLLRDPGVEPLDLSGAWEAADVGTYYTRQIGSDIWWLGLSRDRGATFANVFHGTISGTAIRGDWADVPTGRFRSFGALSLRADRGQHSTTLRAEGDGTFSGCVWEKLYDPPRPAPPPG